MHFTDAPLAVDLELGPGLVGQQPLVRPLVLDAAGVEQVLPLVRHFLAILAGHLRKDLLPRLLVDLAVTNELPYLGLAPSPYDRHRAAFVQRLLDRLSRLWKNQHISVGNDLHPRLLVDD